MWEFARDFLEVTGLKLHPDNKPIYRRFRFRRDFYLPFGILLILYYLAFQMRGFHFSLGSFLYDVSMLSYFAVIPGGIAITATRPSAKALRGAYEELIMAGWNLRKLCNLHLASIARGLVLVGLAHYLMISVCFVGQDIYLEGHILLSSMAAFIFLSPFVVAPFLLAEYFIFLFPRFMTFRFFQKDYFSGEILLEREAV